MTTPGHSSWLAYKIYGLSPSIWRYQLSRCLINYNGYDLRPTLGPSEKWAWLSSILATKYSIQCCAQQGQRIHHPVQSCGTICSDFPLTICFVYALRPTINSYLWANVYCRCYVCHFATIPRYIRHPKPEGSPDKYLASSYRLYLDPLAELEQILFRLVNASDPNVWARYRVKKQKNGGFRQAVIAVKCTSW